MRSVIIVSLLLASTAAAFTPSVGPVELLPTPEPERPQPDLPHCSVFSLHGGHPEPRCSGMPEAPKDVRGVGSAKVLDDYCKIACEVQEKCSDARVAAVEVATQAEARSGKVAWQSACSIQVHIVHFPEAGCEGIHTVTCTDGTYTMTWLRGGAFSLDRLGEPVLDGHLDRADRESLGRLLA